MNREDNRIRRRALLWLAVMAGTLLLGLLLHADAEHATLFGMEGPPCLVRKVLGEHACPGCGLTRSVALAVHGRWGDAFSVHPAGILVALLCAVGIFVHGDIIVRRRRTGVHEKIGSLGYYVFGFGIITSWLLRLI